MERQEEKERELVPVRRRSKPAPTREPLKEIPESPVVKMPEMPRRWYLF